MTLRLRVDSLTALKETLSSKGQHCFGAVGSNDAGKWAIQFYPLGDGKARDGHCSIFIKNMVLAPGLAAVKIEGNVRIVTHDGHKTPSIIPLSPLLSSPSPSSSSSSPGGSGSGVNEGVIPFPAATPSAAAAAAVTTTGTAAAAGAGHEEEDARGEGGARNPTPSTTTNDDPARVNVVTDTLNPPAAATSTEEPAEVISLTDNDSSDDQDGPLPSPTPTPTAAAAAITPTDANSTSHNHNPSSNLLLTIDGSHNTSSHHSSSVLLMTKAFGTCAAFVNPTADGVAAASSWGFHDFCPASELPEAFVIEAEIQTKEIAREDALALHVHSLAALKRQCPRGQSTMGSVHKDQEGNTWSLCLYPNGDNLSGEGQLGVFVKVLSLPRGITAVKVEGNLRVLQGGRILASRSFPVSTFLNASGTGAASSSTWGFHDFCELREVGQQDAFVLEADITVRDRLREAAVQEAPEGYSVERLLDCLRLAHARELQEAHHSRQTLNEAQLRTLTLDQLLELQEHVTNVIKEKRSQENDCAVCQDKVKAIAMVPCGHRFCAECAPNLLTCPECRQHITQKIRLF